MTSRAALLPLFVLPLAGLSGLAACSDDDGGSPATSTVAAPVPTTAAGAGAAAAGIVVVGPQEGADLMLQFGEALTVIDVRTPAEFAEGHVEGAVNYDVESGAFTVQIEGLDRGQPYLVYCRSGRRSAIAAQAMIDAGFTTVYDMGGLQAWADAGLPVVTG